MRARKAILGIALAAVAALGAAPAKAHASDATAGPAICEGVTVGGTRAAYVCIEWITQTSTATVGARVWLTACVLTVCQPWAGGLDKTGFEPRIPKGQINPAGPTWYWPGGTIGALWIDGSPSYIHMDPVCLGNQSYCP